MRRFVLFGECLLVGALVAVAALPVVTLLPALAAGCAHFRAHVDGETTAVRAFFARARAAYPTSLPVSLGAAGGFAVLAVDAVVLRAGLPGAGLVAVVCAAAATGLAVVLLRAAAAWSVGVRWSWLVRDVARHTVAVDPTGSLLLAMALGMLALIAWQLPPLVVPMLGCVVMATVAVQRRHAARCQRATQLADQS